MVRLKALQIRANMSYTHFRAYAYGYAYVGSYLAVIGWVFGLIGGGLSNWTRLVKRDLRHLTEGRPGACSVRGALLAWRRFSNFGKALRLLLVGWSETHAELAEKAKATQISRC